MTRTQGSRSSRTLALVGLAIPLLLFLLLAWGHGGPSEAGWREACRLDVAARGGGEGELGFLDSSPAYHTLLRAWLSLQADLSWARRLSLVLGLVAVAVAWAAGRALFGDAEGTVSAMLLALNPLFYRHTHLISSQACFWAAGAASVGLWYSALSRGGTLRWLAYVATAALALYAGPLGVALVAVQVVMSVWRVLAPSRRERPTRKPVLEVAASTVVLAGLVVVRVLSGIGSPGPVLSPGEKVTGVNLDLLDQAYRLLASGGGFAAVSLGVLGIVGLVTSVRKRVVRSGGIGRVYVDKRRRRPALCLFWVLLVGILVASLFTVPFARSLSPAHLQGLLPFFLMLSARGIVDLASLIGRLTRTLLGFPVPKPVLGGVLSVALLASVSLDSIRRQQAEGSVTEGWRHVGERLTECLALGVEPMVLPTEAIPAIRWNTPALATTAFVEARPAAIGPATICLVASVDELPSPPAELQQLCGQRLQEVDRYLFPGKTGFFSLRASAGLASVARRLLAASDQLRDDSASSDALRDLASACADGGAMEDARRALERLVANEQGSAEDLLFLGIVEEHLGRQDDALGHYRAALSKEPELALAQARIGVILASRGEPAAAREQLEQSRALLASNAEALAALIEVLAAGGDATSVARLTAELERLRPEVGVHRPFGARFELLGYTPEDTAVAPGEPIRLSYYLRCLRPVPTGHQLRHRVVGRGLRVSFQSVDSEDSASVAGARPGETVQTGCSVGVEWTTPGVSGQLQLGLADPGGELLPVVGLGDAWLPVAVLRVTVGEADEPAEVVPGRDLQRRTGFELADGLSVSPDGAWTEFVLGPGRFRVIVEARGMPAAGEWPVLSISVDGSEQSRLSVSRSSWAEYSCSLGEGGRRVKVHLRFLNDYYNAVTGEDRNVIVGSIRLVRETTVLAVAAPE